MSVIDETLQRYQNMSAQAQMPTPGAYNPGTPMPNLLPPPAQIPPIYSMQMEPGSVMSAQAMAYQQIRQNYMSPATAFQAGGSFSNYPNPSQMTMPGMGSFRQAIMPAPPPMTMTPGVTGSFVNPYDAAVSGRMQTQFNMFGDPSRAASNWGSAQANAFGQKIGGGIGAGIGMLAGGPWGAATGYGLGDMLGGALGEIPGVGWAASLPYRDAIQQMSRGTRLQAGTHGAISMGMGDMGLGGRGMNAQAGVGLGRQLQGFAEQSKGAFNINDMINLTSSAAESGLLSGATNTDQIFDSVKRLTGLVGKIAKLTGDPDFKNNIREIANLRNAGFDLSQIPTVMESMNMSARMAGMSRGQVMQAGGLQGGAIFAGAGLSSGLGQQFGAAQAANTVLSGGALSPLLTNLLGGSQGITQRGTELNASFLSGTANLMLPYLVGAGGSALDPSRIQKMLSGGVGLQQMIGQGAGRMDAQSLQNMLMNQPELQSQLGQELGPHGTELAMLRMVQGVQNQFPGMSMEMAATQFAGGDRLSGKMLAGQWKSPERLARFKAQLAENQKREAYEARQLSEEKNRRPDETYEEYFSRQSGAIGTIGLGITRGLGGMLGQAETVNKTIQAGEADRMAREERRKEDEAMGVRRVYGPNWSLGAGEEAAAKTLGGGAISVREHGIEFMKITDDLARRIGADPGVRFTSRGAERTESEENKAQRIRQQLTAEGRNLSDFEEQMKDPKKWEKRLSKIENRLTDKQRATVETTVLEKARQAGRDDKAITYADLRYPLMRDLNMSPREFASIEKMVRDYAFYILKNTHDKFAKHAFTQLESVTGGVSSMHDIESMQKAVDAKRLEGLTTLEQSGISAGMSPEEAESALKKITDAPADVQAAAVLMALADQPGASEEVHIAAAGARKGVAGDKAQALMDSMSDQERKMLSGLGGVLSKAGSVSAASVQRGLEEGILGRGAAGAMGFRAAMATDLAALKDIESVTDVKLLGARPQQSKSSKQLSDLVKALEPLSVADKQAVGASTLVEGSVTLKAAADRLMDAAVAIAKAQGVTLPIPAADAEQARQVYKDLLSGVRNVASPVME